jgi:hydrophobic/amphiphilic exporter-1 (mainly G- bacteria), HAE1 family
MAIAVVGGLVTSTLLSLVVVPSVFTLMDDLEGWLGRHLGRLLSSGPHEAAAPTGFARNRIV